MINFKLCDPTFSSILQALVQELTFFLLVHDVKHLWIFLQTHLGTFYHASISHLLYLYVDFEIKIFGVPFLNKYFST